MADDIQQLLVSLGVDKSQFNADIDSAVNKGVESIKQLKSPAATAGRESGKAFSNEFNREMAFLSNILRRYFGQFGVIAADAIQSLSQFIRTDAGEKAFANLSQPTRTEADVSPVAPGAAPGVAVAVPKATGTAKLTIPVLGVGLSKGESSYQFPFQRIPKPDTTTVEVKKPIVPPIEAPKTTPIRVPVEKPIVPPIEVPKTTPIRVPVEKPIVPPIDVPPVKPVTVEVKKPIVPPIDVPPVKPVKIEVERPKLQKVFGEDVKQPKPLRLPDINPQLEKTNVLLQGTQQGVAAIEPVATRSGKALLFLKAGFVALGSTLISIAALTIAIGAIYKMTAAVLNWNKRVRELNKETGLASTTISGMMSAAGKYGTTNQLESTLKRMVTLLKEVARGSEEAKKQLKGLKIEITGDVNKDFGNMIKSLMDIDDPVEKLMAIQNSGLSVDDYNTQARAFLIKQAREIEKSEPITRGMGYNYQSKPIKYEPFDPSNEQFRQAAFKRNLDNRKELLAELEKQDEFEKKSLTDKLRLLEQEWEQLIAINTYDAKSEDELQKKIIANKNERKQIERDIQNEAEQSRTDEEQWLNRRKQLTEQIYNLEASMTGLRNQEADRNRWTPDQLVDDRGNWLQQPMTQQGDRNIRAAWEIKNAEGWAKRYMLEGREDLSSKAQSYADDVAKASGFLTSQERDPMGAVRENTRRTADELSELKDELLKGNIIATPRNG